LGRRNLLIVLGKGKPFAPQSNLMLELRNVSLSAARAEDESWLLRGINARFRNGHLHAVVGPSGCGKSTLIKVIAGIREPTEGTVHWEERNLDEDDLGPHEIGYVPQFSTAFDLLRVDESVETALLLRVGGLTSEEIGARVSGVLNQVGLAEIADRRVGLLSGGQRRRLALSLELVSQPLLLLCDEVTSGLDPKSESEVVELLHRISAQDRRTVISVTHSLRHLQLHDAVTVLYEGKLVFQASPSLLAHYFHIAAPEDLFPTLGLRSSDEWRELWEKHGTAYNGSAEPERIDQSPMEPTEFQTPGFISQFRALIHRRGRLFVRDRGQIALQLALLFGFPCLVVIFAWGGLPQIQNLTGISSNAWQQMLETATFALRSSRVANLVSGLVMFQVILLTLMGCNNAAREIAGERSIYEKEKFAGLRPLSYLASKVVFLGALIAAQSIWMALFVTTIVRFPGDLVAQIAILALTNAAMTFVCLAISSLARTAENASLLSIYLVGFQLPLSGAVLALPKMIGMITRPFIAGFWGWSGFLQTMRDTRFYDFVQSVTQTELAAFELCAWVLFMHAIGGILVAYVGLQNSRWD
jgi:ABC-type multidrug transport system ATPase subunit